MAAVGARSPAAVTRRTWLGGGAACVCASPKRARAAEGPGRTADEAEGKLAALAALRAVEAARREVEAVAAELAQASTQGTNPDWKRIAARLKSDDVGAYPTLTIPLDRYVGPIDLEAWEQRTWATLPDYVADGSSVPVPQIERPNAFWCAIFSCIDDPRQLASTSSNASLKMLRDGASMAARGDTRVTADSLSYNAQDVLDKMALYIEFAKRKLE